MGKTEFDLLIARSILLNGIVNHSNIFCCNFVGHCM